jgi:small subunit ribosomal protein S1
LATDVVAVLKASEISPDRVEDARNVLNEGDSVEAKIVGVDRKNRAINLSVKAKDQVDTRRAMGKLRDQEAEPESSGPTTIGDLIKQQMGGE